VRRIIHLDMDAFFASVEQRDRPELRGQPVIVGGAPGSRGVVSAASYEARKYGVRSAMPSSRAKRLCPQGVFLPVDGERYRAASRQVMAILQEVTPLVEPLSCDEAFLDVTGSRALFGEAEAIGRRLKERIREEVRLTASVGVAPNKFLAKLASDLEKPDGFVVVPEGQEAEFLRPLPISRLWGVGPATAARLEAIGLRTIGAVADSPLFLLRAELGDHAAELQRLARGLDDRPVHPDQEAKSISAETTFDADTDDREFLNLVLLGLAEEVGERVRHAGVLARTVTLKIRFEDFTTRTRDTTLPEATASALAVCERARELLGRIALGTRKVRLIGVGASHFTTERQLALFSGVERRSEQAERAMDELNRRFGASAVKRAALLKRKPRRQADPKPED
jgi:DNA polymerase-4